MKIPKSVNSLTLKQFIRFEQLKAQEFKDKDDIPGECIRADRQLSCVTGLSLDQIGKLSIVVLEKCYKKIARLNQSKPNLKVNKTIWLRGKRYKFFKSEKELTANQYTAFKKYQEGANNTIHNYGSIAYLSCPLFKQPQFKAENVEQIANDFLLFGKVGKVYGAIFFYMNELEKWNLISQASLMIAEIETDEKITERVKEALMGLKELGLSMDGTISSISSQAEMLLKKMN